MAMALAAVLGGPFSRTGYGQRIAFFSAAAVVIRIVGFGAQAACDGAPALNVIQYAIPLVTIWLSFGQIFRQKASATRAIQGLTELQPIGAR
jgi:lipopolysaccharide export system permease protein